MKKFSLASKLIIGILIVFIITVCAINSYSFKKISSNVYSLYASIQKGVLDASFTTINITMNIEAKLYLANIAKKLEEIGRSDVVAQRRVLFDLANLISYPAVYVIYESDGSTLTEYLTNDSNYKFSNSYDVLQKDLRHSDYYVQTKNNFLNNNSNDGIVTPTYVSESGLYKGRMLSTITAPLVSQSGQFMGIVAIDVFVGGFQERFEHFMRKELPSLDVYIADSKGKIFSHKDKSLVNSATELPQESALREGLQKSPEGTINYFDTSHNERVGFYRQFPFGWTIVVAAKKSDYTDIIHEDFLGTLALSVIVIAIGSSILFFMIRFFISPIQT
uniref:cache domain-containing protein n=1 Tax=Helicobacter aurati TaxID=137778 RepID=UPI0018F82E9E